ncbi:Per1 [Pyrrhoderma noxium]|uniref:Post-GPI attachment to proteins factor 3 n=1 Tax=Pyrrhoderma noxium TaxID=2282107 RepID=A0A286UUY4_9AGAM|nr:Per1 [Pyrrhoderma noxium]
MTDRALLLPRPEPVLQYYGKWPFWRFMGMQEPSSVVFSMGNLFMLLWSVVSMNAWVWSAVFHTRDMPTTEKLDYFSAALVFITALHSLVTRFFLIGRPYRFNLTLGLTHNLLWLFYSLPSRLTIVRRFPPNPFFPSTSNSRDVEANSAVPRSYRPPCASKAAIGVGLMMCAMSLELLDFPPIGRILDAHALWHAATVPIGEMWYNFLIEDALDEGWGLDGRKRRIEKSIG